MKTNQIIKIERTKLIAHPDNPNRMSEQTFRKLVRNIQKSKIYEPIIVRKEPEKNGFYQIINGAHRVKALQQLGLQKAECVVWDVDDRQTAILLATLNRLSGTDVLDKKLELLKKLKADFQTGELSKLLPYTKKQIEKLTTLKPPALAAASVESCFAKALVFFVTEEQLVIIEKAISSAEESNSRMTRPKRRAAALTKIAKKVIRQKLRLD